MPSDSFTPGDQALPASDYVDSTARFPVTRKTWIHRVLDDPDEGRADALRYVMEVYSEPLKAYARARGYPLDPEDAVHGFFTRSFLQPGYLDKWRGSERPLRLHLATGLDFYVRSLLRNERNRETLRERAHQESRAGEHVAPDPIEVLRRELLLSLAANALRTGEEDCRKRGLALHWRAFEAHLCERRPFREIGDELGVNEERASIMARSGVRAFRRAVEGLMQLEGIAPGRVEEAVLDLLDSSAARG